MKPHPAYIPNNNISEDMNVLNSIAATNKFPVLLLSEHTSNTIQDRNGSSLCTMILEQLSLFTYKDPLTINLATYTSPVLLIKLIVKILLLVVMIQSSRSW